VSAACRSIWTSCVTSGASLGGLADRAGRGVPAQVEEYTDAERVILADAYQALLQHGPLPHPGSRLAIHRLRDPRAGDAYVLVLPRIVLGYQVLGDVIVAQAADVIRT
jgi:hypothetical protein